MKHHRVVAIGLAMVVGALGVYRLLAHRDIDHALAGAPASSSPTPNPSAPMRPPEHVTKLASPAERQALADRIAAAQAARAVHAPARPTLPAQRQLSSGDVDRATTDILDALKETVPYLADCYNGAAAAAHAKVAKTALVRMTLTGAHDVGTLVDSDGMSDADDQALDPELAYCLKTTLESLELPPLVEGDSLKIQYSFRFDD